MGWGRRILQWMTWLVVGVGGGVVAGLLIAALCGLCLAGVLGLVTLVSPGTSTSEWLSEMGVAFQEGTGFVAPYSIRLGAALGAAIGVIAVGISAIRALQAD